MTQQCEASECGEDFPRVIFCWLRWNFTCVYNCGDLNFADYEGRVTVPVLWDKTEKKIVNNESSEILRVLNSEFNELCPNTEAKELDLYPKLLRKKIDKVNSLVYE